MPDAIILRPQFSTAIENHAAFLRRFRLLPSAHMPDGYVAWCQGSDVLCVDRLNLGRSAPVNTDNARLSVYDYLAVTRAIANGEGA